MQQERIIEQLEKMVASGRVTPEEADRLRATAGTAEFDVDGADRTRRPYGRRGATGEVRAGTKRTHVNGSG